MSIWFKNYTAEDANKKSDGTLMENYEIDFIEIGDNFLRATMPVQPKHVTPLKVLHGGASVALCESVASTAANLTINYQTHFAVGLEINANHLKSVPINSTVEAISKPIHIGRRTQVWETNILFNQQISCVCRMTLAIIERK